MTDDTVLLRQGEVPLDQMAPPAMMHLHCKKKKEMGV